MEGVSLSADKQQLSVSLPHLGLGDEVIPALVSAVEALAGPEALQKLTLVLHCNEEQEEAVVADLRGKNFCG